MRGFTLVEVLIAIAILVVITSLCLFLTVDTFRLYLARSERDVIVSTLQSARASAMANSYNTAWGVCNDGTNYVLFRGWYGSDPSTYQRTTIPQGVTVSSSEDQFACDHGGLVFSQLAGTTTSSTITIVQSAKTSTVTTNYEGTIAW